MSDERFIRETGLAATIATAIDPVIADLGYRLVRVQLSGRDGQTVQIMAERPDGTMTAGDCETVSRQVSAVLDVLDPIEGAFHLEISSPGIDRPLVRPSDFENWAGYEARVELKEPVSSRRRFKGTLDGFEDGEVRMLVDVKDAETGKTSHEVVGFPVALVSDARLILTDDLIRESLTRAKKAREQRGQPDLDEEAMDGAEIDNFETAPDADVSLEKSKPTKPKAFNARGNYAKTSKRLKPNSTH